MNYSFKTHLIQNSAKTKKQLSFYLHELTNLAHTNISKYQYLPMMSTYAYVLIPQELSLVLGCHKPSSCGDSRFPVSMEMRARVRSNVYLLPGTVFYPEEGEVRIERLDNSHILEEDDVSISFSC